MLTLASDFGSPYPAAMKGVILRRSDARLVDVAHDLPRGDVRAGAFWLRFVLPEFPPAVHLAVGADPGVDDRDAVVVRAGEHALVGPDNGLLLPAARALADGERLDAFRVADGDPASATFHGRDVFAPLAADVHEVGVGNLADIDRLEPTADPVDLTFPAPEVDHDGERRQARGEVLVVDGFGNAITNVPGDFLGDAERVRVDGEWAPAVETFAAVDRGERLVTVGSHGYLECDVNDGRGTDAFGLGVGDHITLVVEH